MMTHTEEQFMQELRELGEVKEDGVDLIIETIESDKVIQVFRQHGMSYASRGWHIMKSRKPSKKPRILWSFKQISYFGIPFKIRAISRLTCKLGWNWKDPTGQFAKSARLTSLPPDKKRLTVKHTSKIGCPAIMKILEVYTFPEYKVSPKAKGNLNTVQSKLMERLHSALSENKEVIKEARYFIVVSKASVHNHPIWELTAPFFPRDAESLQSQILYERASSQNWLRKTGTKASCNSLAEWVSLINSKGELIRFFKEAGTESQTDGLKINDFVLIFFNDAQMDALREFGKKCICIDSHVLNAFNNVLMTSLTVVDNMKHGFPVAFMFSSRVNAAVLEIFYQAIRSAFGVRVETDLLVSDMDGAYCSSWASVMTPAKNVIYSAWSVDKAWCEHLTLITDDAKQSLAYKNLLALLEEPDESEFNVLFEDFCRWVVDDDRTREFGTYFIENFGSNAIHWAQCGHHWMGINFKLTLERAHNTLQHIILKGDNSKPLEKSVQELMRFCRDKTLERVHPKNRIHGVSQAHVLNGPMLRGLQLDKEGEAWVGKFSDAVAVRIVKFQPECRCIMKCTKCNGCTHMFVCSCPWSSVYLNMCRHIHMLCDTLDLPSTYSLLIEKRENAIKAGSEDNKKDVAFLTGTTPLTDPFEDEHFEDRQAATSLMSMLIDSNGEAAILTGSPAWTPLPAADRFAENRRRIADLMKAIQTRLGEADTEGEFDVVEELLQQAIPVADAHKAEVQSKVKVITLEGGGVIPSYRTPEPVAKKRRVEVQLNRQHESVVIQKHQSPSTPDTNQNAGMEMILGRQLAGSEEIVYGEEVILECNEVSDGIKKQ